MVLKFKKLAVICILFWLTSIIASAQTNYVNYGKQIYNLILENDNELLDEFVDLQDYTAYIDRLDKLPQAEKEEIKRDASRSYTDVLKDYEAECARILKLYANSKKEGITFTYSTAEFKPSRNFPNIGIITFYYIVDIPGFEEPEEDGLRFECIKTKNGWRILDGFFDLTD